MNAPTRLFDILEKQVKTLPIKRALNTKYNGKWVPTSSEDFLEQSKQMMKQRNMKNDKVNTERAFRLIKRDEEIAQSNKKWWAHLKQLKN